MKRILLVLVSVLCVFVLGSCASLSGRDGTNVGEGAYSEEISEEESVSLLAQDIYLPIGSVVNIENHKSKIMIIGVLQRDANNPTELYDYSGVDYPVGLIDPDSNYIFNKSQIEQVVFLGYWNDDQDILQDKIKTALSELD